MKEQLNQILNTVALVAYYLPLAVVLFKKLWKDVPVLMFSCYWTLGGIINFIGSTSLFPAAVIDTCILVFNIIDVPFVLIIFYLNTKVSSLKSTFLFLCPVYLAIQLINGFVRGFTDESFKYFLGIGVFIVITCIIAEIMHYFRKLDHTSREKAINFLYLAVLFEYAVYVYYWFFRYFHKTEKADDDILSDINIIYYGSTLIGIIIACFGFFSDNLITKPPPPPAPREHEVLINIID